MMKITHEQFVEAIRTIGAMRLSDPAEQAQAFKVKMVYGGGTNSKQRGRTIFDGWTQGNGDKTALAEVCAVGEKNYTQLAGTTLHELAHALAGAQHGHDKVWREWCAKLGLRAAKVHQVYLPAALSPEIREELERVQPTDGRPNFTLTAPECSHGWGSRGGKSRGAGSGSRLRKYVCRCGQIIRASTDELDATHGKCGTLFEKV